MKGGTLSDGDKASKSEPHPIDVHVGNRVRLRRVMIGMSQVKLAKEVGLTFQQIQKYEKGTNRICASRLFEFAQILEVPVEYFFEDTEAEGTGQSEGEAEAGDPYSIYDFLSSHEGVELNRAFLQIKEAKVRRVVLELMRSLVD